MDGQCHHGPMISMTSGVTLDYSPKALGIKISFRHSTYIRTVSS
jgi:hypothetical protein